MADRNVVGSNTFEQFRVEFNELATDVGDIVSITGASGIIASATDVIEAVTTLNTSIGNTVDLPDSAPDNVNLARIKLGDDDDMQMFHDGTNSNITNSTGSLFIKGATVELRADHDDVFLKAVKDNQVELYFNNSKKLETTNTHLNFERSRISLGHHMRPHPHNL